MLKSTMRLLGVTIFMFAAMAARAQDDSPFLKPTASLSGNTGLWKVHSAENLRPKEAAFSVWVDRINRNPGDLRLTTIGFGGGVGITRHIELGINFEVNRRVSVGNPYELSFGQQELGFFGLGGVNARPFPNERIPGSLEMPQLRTPATPTGALSGSAGYFNNAPFATSGSRDGVGNVNVGLKVNLLDERDGDSFGVGFRTYVVVPTHRSLSYLRFRPTQTGGWQFGNDLLVSKNAGMATLYGNAGFRAVASPDDARAVQLSDVVPLSFGIELPRQTRFQFLGELGSEIFVGNHTPNTSKDSLNPVDITVGLRAFINRYLNFSGGYRHPLNMSGGDKNGFVFQLGYNYGAPQVTAPPAPPSLSCSANPTEAQVGQIINLTSSGTSSTGAALTYAWSTTGGTIQGSGQNVSVSTTGAAPGTYVATVRATETSGVFADCSARFTVVAPPPPPMPPTVSCNVDRARVQIGEVVNLTATPSSPQNRPVTVQWTTSGGTIVGSGASVKLDTARTSPGTITARAKATDDRNLSAECTSTVTVEAPPPPPPTPQVQMLDSCTFANNSGRVDNVCKAKLDAAALRLQSEPESSLVVVGSAASTERNAQALSQSRADNIRAYLTKEKGIAEGRLTSRTSAAGTGAAARKADIHLVPRGATFTGYNLNLDRQRVIDAMVIPAPAKGNQQDASKRVVIASLQ
jgi:outer membrane protein OmpA-like peptidoglycan-associated protein